MKLGVKPLKGEQFEVEVTLDESAASLKQKIAAARPELTADTQKLVCSGKVLANDAASLKDLGVKDGDFVVVMTQKPKAADAAPAAAAAAPAAPAAPAQAPAPAAEAPLNEAAVTMLCEMGFPRPEVEKCMRAAFNNPDRAAEYLMGGIPANAQAPPAAAPTPTPAPAAPAPAPTPAPAPAPMPAAAPGGAPAGFPPMGFPPMAGAGRPAAAATGPLAKLRQHPQFEQFKMCMQNTPERLNAVLNVWMKNDPDVLKLIAEHQAEFVEMLQEPQDPAMAMLAAMQAAAVQGGQPPAQGGAMPAAPGAPGAPGAAPAAPPAPQAQMQATPADIAAIDRLMALGFPRERCAEALFLSNRNEEVAANYLFDSMES